MRSFVSKTLQLRRVVVTGMGAITPIGNDLDSYWRGLIDGENGAGPITRFDAGAGKTRFACEVKGFDPLAHFERKEASRMDLFTQFAMVAVEQAIQDAKINLAHTDRDEVGVIWASGIGGLGTLQGEIMAYAGHAGRERFSPFLVPKMIADIAAGTISIKYGFRGPNFCTVSACASSNHALLAGLNAIRLGQAKIIVAGGSEAPVSLTGVGAFGAMHALSTRNDAPAAASRPCDAGRDGFVLGEGAGALVLEDMEHALARNAPIYAELTGGGASADAYHITATHPEGVGAKLAMARAMRDAGIGCADIDYINAHATSTPVGDAAEMHAIASLFGEHLSSVAISATKSMTGHLLGAAGAIEAIACVLSIRYGRIPPTVNLDLQDAQMDPRLQLTPQRSKAKMVNTAMSNNFGFGGHNAVAIFGKFEP